MPLEMGSYRRVQEMNWCYLVIAHHRAVINRALSSSGGERTRNAFVLKDWAFSITR